MILFTYHSFSSLVFQLVIHSVISYKCEGPIVGIRGIFHRGSSEDHINGRLMEPIAGLQKIEIIGMGQQKLKTSNLHEIRLSMSPLHICPSCSTTYTRTWMGCPINAGKFGR